MTGEEFLNKVREIKEIHSITWEIKGDPLNADRVGIKVVADNGEYSLHLGSPALHSNRENLLESVYYERVSVCLLINKTMELLGRPERFDIGCGLNICNAIGFAMKCTQELSKT